ncbi:hypothetical protein FOA52_001658 [Chlamydomonas sp. UWO 241]|nr:hypothetical protein FOA52_001658 [Chlamydomonas sp. UWO 241]
MAQTFKSAGVQGLPDAWTAKPREKLASCQVVVEFQVNPEQLKVLDAAGNTRINLGSVFDNGFWMTAYLRCWASTTAPGHLTLACFAKVDVAKMTTAAPQPEHAAVAFTCSMQVGMVAESRNNFIISDESWGFNTLSASAPSVTALVAPHLEGGQFKGKVTFTDVDLLHIRT